MVAASILEAKATTVEAVTGIAVEPAWTGAVSHRLLSKVCSQFLPDE